MTLITAIAFVVGIIAGVLLTLGGLMWLGAATNEPTYCKARQVEDLHARSNQ